MVDSDNDYTSEDSKKRSLEIDADNIFNKSKKLSRTPTKQQKDENKIDQLLKMMQNLTDQTQSLTSEVKGIKEEQREYRNDLRELRKEINEFKQSNQQLQKENDEMKQELKIVKMKVEKFEKERKANNIIVQGLPMDTKNPNVVNEVMADFVERELVLKNQGRTERKDVQEWGEACADVRWFQDKKMELAGMKMLRWTLGKTRRDKISNDVITKRAGVTTVSKKVQEQRLQWFGEVRRRSETKDRAIES
uniref:Uncharacterized protein LOC114326313 n=1 Tax=Diabrotica virgifera virgifera TaxID=50390 RepID=A0A6P7F423_DIAVI